MNVDRIFCLAGFILSSVAGGAWAETMVYVSEGKDNQIGVYSMDEATGELSEVEKVALGGSPGCLALSKDGTKIYAAVRTTAEFATLEIDEDTGRLREVGSVPAAGGAAYIWVDATGEWLLAAYYRDGLVSSSRIEDGLVTGEPVSVLEVGEKAHCIQTDPSNGYAFCPHTMDLNKVDQFTFDAETGELILNPAGAAMAGAEGAGPRHLQFHPNGKWVYLVNEQGKSVSRCDFDGVSGTLTLRETVSTHPEDWDPSEGSCADIEITTDGKFLYASNRGHNSIAGFSIDGDTGELTALGQTPTGDTPRSFNLVPVGNEEFVVAAGQRSDTLTVYRRDAATGVLTKIETIPSGGGPAWVLAVSENSD
ncbi:MAG: lactonase family protein [Verrucomicrobiota bacterium]